MAQFNYGPIVATANRLVKQFGKQTQISLIRNVASTPDDADKPWRGSAAEIKEFKFTGLAFTTPIPKIGAPSHDQDQNVIAPGDLTLTAAEGDPSTICGLPTVSDYIKIGSTYYSILGVNDVTPDVATAVILMTCRAWPLLTRQPSTPF